MTHQDTIFALATAPGRSGVAVIRVSGIAALAGLCAISTDMTARPPAPRMAHLATLRHPVSHETLDKALILYFKNPASYTGEDVVEYHLHGGTAVVQSVLAALGELPQHRMAEPGEFTRRAFENGKMDLTGAEAVADLIDAETAAQKIQALSQMGGALSALYEGWMTRLKTALAHLEADIEFPDEDMPEGIAPVVSRETGALMAEIDAHLNDNRRGERLRDGIQVAVIGAPNAGKSSLVNALARRDVAIVSDMAGTTRDVIEVHLDMGGYPVILADTAGLRPELLAPSAHGENSRTTQDSIESEGIRRALARAQSADIKMLVFDGTAEVPDSHTLALMDKNAILVINKMDCHSEAQPKTLKTCADILRVAQDDIISVSAKAETGLDMLIQAITAKAQDLIGTNETPSLTRRRHRKSVEEALESLKRSQNAALPELMAEDIRLSVRALGRITGRVDVEDLLDVIFRDFCIGK